MFEIKIYETPAGNRPFEKYIEKLSKKHKTDEVTEIFNYLDKLAKFTWGSRPTNAKIVAIEGAPTISNIDKMLQDQAACQVGITSSDLTYYKTITATGTRTSASDAAIQTLQSNG